MTRRLWYSLTIAVLAITLLPVNATAAPADTTETETRVGPEMVELLRLLNSDSVAEQERAVQRIGTFAHTGRGDAKSFDRLIAPLLGLVMHGETEAVRIMAVSALASIGTYPAMQGLQVQVDHIESTRLRRIVQNALIVHSARRIAARKK